QKRRQRRVFSALLIDISTTVRIHRSACLHRLNFERKTLPVLEKCFPILRGQCKCYASSAVQMYKSLGLIPPDMTLSEFEDTYTNIFDEEGAAVRRRGTADYTIPDKYKDS